jgi:DNA-binding XRE family transcriptional regulator
MNSAKRKSLEAKGFKVGSVQDFLELSPEEAAYIELKIALGKKLQAYRVAKRFTQSDVARRINSSQSRVAKMESGDPSVSIDLLFRSLFALGATRKQLADVFSVSR